MENGKLNIATMAELFADENKAREFLEKQRWPDGPVCPHCDCKDVYKLTPKPGSKSPVRPGVYKCKECRKQFTVRIGTIMEESLVPYRKWLMAFHLLSSSKKGMSSHQIAREVGVTQKTAWFINHRIRLAMTKEPMAGMLSGVVEADETYVGGKPKYGKPLPKVRSQTLKTPVLALIQRDGAVVATPLEKVNSKSLKGNVEKYATPDSAIMTDECNLYRGLNKKFASHDTVQHSIREYVKRRPDGLLIHVNTAESFFALLNRGHYGIFHWISKKHLHRYVDEFVFRWDNRKTKDGERMVAAIRGAEGKRLMYREPIKGLV